MNNFGKILSVFRIRNRPYEERYVCGGKGSRECSREYLVRKGLLSRKTGKKSMGLENREEWHGGWRDKKVSNVWKRVPLQCVYPTDVSLNERS